MPRLPATAPFWPPRARPRRALVLAGLLAGLAISVALSGCASVTQRVGGANEQSRAAGQTAGETVRAGLPGAATAPLEDLNIRREDIPEALAQIDYVYEAAPAPECFAIITELNQLNAVLGKDYDQEAEEKSLGVRSGEAAGDFVIDTVKGLSTGWIPYRGLVREATGAAANDRRVSRAFTAGLARRAYLRGLAVGQGCTPPAAPSTLVAPAEDEPDIEVRAREAEPVRTQRRWGPPTGG